MHRPTKRQIASLFLALAMLISGWPITPLITSATPADPPTQTEFRDYGKAIGSIAEFATYWVKVWTAPNGDCLEPTIRFLPGRVQILDYHYDESRKTLWYKIDAAPGERSFPELLQDYRWVKASCLRIVNDGFVGIFADGEPVTGITLSDDSHRKLRAESSLQGAVRCQWQILVDRQHDLWADIHGQTKAELTLTPGMVATLLDGDLTAYIRCVTKSGSKSAASEAIPVTVMPTATASRAFALRNAATLDATDTVSVTVRFVYGSDGTAVSGDRVYEIQSGADLSDTFLLPVVTGYSAYLEDDTSTIHTECRLNLTGVTEDTVITFRYWPAKVDYTVIYYWQNIEDDGYTEYTRKTYTDFTGKEATVENLEWEGFYRLLYETVPIAADGSTVIEVYYDRLYYKMTFDLGGGYGVQPIYARYGTGFTVPNPTKAGYAFAGWDNVTGGAGDGIPDILPTAIPPYHSAYAAIWEAVETAKVSVVVWGENANNEGYSYIPDSSLQLFAKPGTVITYGGLTCPLENHQHTQEECYQFTCETTEHDHTEAGCAPVCGLAEGGHSHTTDCYSHVGNKQNVLTGTPSSPAEGQICNHWYYGKLIFLQGAWYLYSGDLGDGEVAQPICGKAEGSHTHTDACYACGIPAHSHSFPDCYSLTCGKTDHTHTDGCYLAVNGMDSNLWTFVKSDTVTVAADGSSVVNVYFGRTEKTLTFHYDYRDNRYQSTKTITAKWGADISESYKAIVNNAGSTFWSEQSSGNGPYTNYIGIMPKTEKTYYNRGTTGSEGTMTYWGQDLNGNYTMKLFEVTGIGGYTVTDEDRYEFEGFTYHHGTNNGSSASGAAFYYTRNSYRLEFSDGYDVVRTESVLYEASLAVFRDYVPTLPAAYEPGSHVFGSWYLNPECTGQEFLPAEHTMPADNQILYAKWVPATHTVKFYADQSLVGTDEIYNGYAYEIPHGSLIQDPYFPPVDPVRGQYIFVGWFYLDAQGNEQMWDLSSTTVTADTDLYAKWSSNTLMPYQIRFVYKDGDNEVEIADRISGSALGGTSKTFFAKANEQLYAGYQTGYFPMISSHTIVIDLENTDSNFYTFYYVRRESVPYTVRYLDAATGTELLPSVTHSDNTKAMVTETYKKIDGYLPDHYQQSLIIRPDGKNEIIFRYTKDTENGMYVVHYWIESPDGTYAEHSVFEGRGKDGSAVSATVKTIEYYTYDPENPNEKRYGIIRAEDILELHLYYKENTVNIHYEAVGTGGSVSPADETLKVLSGVAAGSVATAQPGYRFAGWFRDEACVMKVSDDPHFIPQKIGDKNVEATYYAKFVPGFTSLTIYKEGAAETDKNQTFLFRVQGEGVDLTVTIHGNSSVTIDGLKAGGYYTITEVTNWSWRYQYASYETPLSNTKAENGATVILDTQADANRITFRNQRISSQWLDGSAWADNIFNNEP